MKYPRPNQHKQPEAFRAHLQGIAPDLDVDDTLLAGDGPLGESAVVAGRQAANRFAVQPMEGWDGSVEGTPSQNTLRRWRNFGLSGASLLWGGEAFVGESSRRTGPPRHPRSRPGRFPIQVQSAQDTLLKDYALKWLLY